MDVRSSGGALTSMLARRSGGAARTGVVDVDDLPAANRAPKPPDPAPAPAAWTLAAFARREFDLTSGFSSRSLTGTPSGLSIETAAPESVAAAEPVVVGPPSATSKLVTATLRAVSEYGDRVGVDVFRSVYELAVSDSPPRLATVGLNVQSSEFNGWTVWELAPANPSGKYVVAIHGGGYVLKPSSVLEWPHFAAMARNTGATVIVPIYPLAPQGTAGTVVPQMADLIAYEIDEHGAENVSVYGISAGGNLALTAVQELVRRGDVVPSRMVLLSPGVDFSLSNPDIEFIDDPIVSASLLRDGQQWLGGLDPEDPLASPLYGSLEGLPPTVIYSGTKDVVYPDLLLLKDQADATPGANLTFVVGEDQLHAWPLLGMLPEAKAATADIYEQLGLVDS